MSLAIVMATKKTLRGKVFERIGDVRLLLLRRRSRPARGARPTRCGRESCPQRVGHGSGAVNCSGVNAGRWSSSRRPSSRFHSEPAEEPPDPNRHPIWVVVTDDLDRSRLTVAFRLMLSIPLWIWLVIWSITVFFVAIVNWFLTLIKGRSPLSLHDFFASYIRFTTHLHAYFFLAADPYPSFSGKPGYPVDVEIDPPERQSRWKTLFRIVLVIPAAMIAATLVGSPGGGSNSSTTTIRARARARGSPAPPSPRASSRFPSSPGSSASSARARRTACVISSPTGFATRPRRGVTSSS